MAPKDHQYATGVELYPELDKHLQSNVKGLHIIGAASGSPLLKRTVRWSWSSSAPAPPA
jgi:hypothetical protein